MPRLTEVTVTPCRQCPWRKAAAPGWLGPHDAEEWVRAAHGEAVIACHMTANDETDSTDEWVAPLRQCAGAARYRANVLKLPINPEVAVGPKDPDVFESPREFVEHHNRGPRRPA